VAGEPLAAAAAVRRGYDAREVDLIGGLVRWHLLLAEVSTTRDLEDPATVAHVVERIPDVETLDLLEVLTEADARATSPQAWTSWRAGLVAGLARRVRTELDASTSVVPDDAPLDVEVSSAVRADPSRLDVRLVEEPDGSTLTVVSRDRVGLIADIAGALAVMRASVRSARAWTQGDLAVSVWDVADTHLDAAILRQRLDAVVQQRQDPGDRLRRPREGGLEPSVGPHRLDSRTDHLCLRPSPTVSPRRSRTCAARDGSLRRTSTRPRGRSASRCSRRTSRCPWSRGSSTLSRSAPAARRSAVR
jgi:[protein-PII] uridylyltransferase